MSLLLLMTLSSLGEFLYFSYFHFIKLWLRYIGWPFHLYIVNHLTIQNRVLLEQPLDPRLICYVDRHIGFGYSSSLHGAIGNDYTCDNRYPCPQLNVILTGFHGLWCPTNHWLLQLVSLCFVNGYTFVRFKWFLDIALLRSVSQSNVLSFHRMGSKPEIQELVNAEVVTKAETMTIAEIYAYIKQESAKVKSKLYISQTIKNATLCFSVQTKCLVILITCFNTTACSFFWVHSHDWWCCTWLCLVLYCLQWLPY